MALCLPFARPLVETRRRKVSTEINVKNTFVITDTVYVAPDTPASLYTSTVCVEEKEQGCGLHLHVKAGFQKHHHLKTAVILNATKTSDEPLPLAAPRLN